MNAETAFAIITFGSLAVPLLVQNWGREWLIALLPIYLIIANTFANTFVLVFGLPTSLAVPVYSTTFLIVDMLIELYDARSAKLSLFAGFLGQILLVLMALLVLYSPIDPHYAAQYHGAFERTPRLVFGSFIAYVVSQLADIAIYSRIRTATGPDKWLWVRNDVATGLSQGIDTAVFMFIAFWAAIPFETWEKWRNFVLVTWAIKMVIAIIDTPYLYVSRRIAGLPNTAPRHRK